MIARSWWIGKGIDYKTAKGNFRGDVSDYILATVMATQLYKHKIHRNEQLKEANFTECKAYLNKPDFSKIQL